MDAGIDSDMGIYLNGGTVVASGNMMDRIEGGDQNYAVFSFAEQQTGGTAYTLKDANGQAVGEWTPANDYTYLAVSGPDLTAGIYTLWQGETQMACSTASDDMGGRGMGGGMPMDGTTPPDGQNPPESFERPEGMERPEGESGQRPQYNEDGTVTLPDGTTVDPSQMTPPDGKDRLGKFTEEQGDPGERTTEFLIADGGSYFSRITGADI